MTRRGSLLLAATGATLLLAAWVSAAGPIGIFARPDLSAFTANVAGNEDVPTGGSGHRRGASSSGDVSTDNQTLVHLIELLMKAIVVVVVLVVLVVIARALVERWKARELLADEDAAAPDQLRAALLRQARESEEAIDVGTPANAVVAAWVGFEDAVRSAGVRDDRSRTSEELVRTVLRSYAVDRASLDVLADLYREARFSRHEVTEAMRERARASLQRVHADLRRDVEAHAGPAGTAPRGGTR